MRRGVKGIYNSTDWLMPADIRTSISFFSATMRFLWSTKFTFAIAGSVEVMARAYLGNHCMAPNTKHQISKPFSTVRDLFLVADMTFCGLFGCTFVAAARV